MKELLPQNLQQPWCNSPWADDSGSTYSSQLYLENWSEGEARWLQPCLQDLQWAGHYGPHCPTTPENTSHVEIMGRALFEHNNSLSLRVLLHPPHLYTAFSSDAQLCSKAGLLLRFSRNTQTHLLFVVSSLRDYLYLEPHINPPHKNVPRAHLSKNY